MIKYLLFPICTILSLYGEDNISVMSDKKGMSQSNSEQRSLDQLPDDQRHVLDMLSPLYQRIYIYGLDDNQREAVAVFERRGENPYTAIDNILKRDRMRSDPYINQDKSPSGRTKRSSSTKNYIFSEMNHEARLEDENLDSYNLDSAQASLDDFKRLLIHVAIPSNGTTACASCKVDSKKVSKEIKKTRCSRCNSCKKRTINKYRYVESYSRCKCKGCTK